MQISEIWLDFISTNNMFKLSQYLIKIIWAHCLSTVYFTVDEVDKVFVLWMKGGEDWVGVMLSNRFV